MYWLGLARGVGGWCGGRLEQRPGDVSEVIVDGSLGWRCLHGERIAAETCGCIG